MDWNRRGGVLTVQTRGLLAALVVALTELAVEGAVAPAFHNALPSGREVVWGKKATHNKYYPSLSWPRSIGAVGETQCAVPLSSAPSWGVSFTRAGRASDGFKPRVDKGYSWT